MTATRYFPLIRSKLGSTSIGGNDRKGRGTSSGLLQEVAPLVVSLQ